MTKRGRARQLPSGIYRLDLPGKSMDGWNVQISRNRRTFSKYFSNLAHGGEREALAAALRYRRRIVRQHPALARADYAAIVRRNNTSGVSGVGRSPAKGRGAQWVARWVPQSGGRAKTVKFSVARYGEARAKSMATEARRKALEEMTGFWKEPPAARVRKPRRAPAADGRIARVAVGEKRLTLTLRDARLVSIPWWLVPKLQRAGPASRQAVRISQDARAIEWPALGVKFFLKELLADKL